MKNILYYMAAFIGLSLVACQTNDEKLFSDSSSIYFDLNGVDKDSIVWTFAKTTDVEHVLEIPLEIAGYQANHDRTFKVKVNHELTTAQEGLHYKAIQEEQILPKNSFTTVLPITLYYKDKTLDNQSVSLQLDIIPNENFRNETIDRQTVCIKISNYLPKPKYWDMIYGPNYFGEYSKVKHKLILSVCGLDELPRYKYENRKALCGYGYVMKNYFETNYPVYDENNQIIEYNWDISF